MKKIRLSILVLLTIFLCLSLVVACNGKSDAPEKTGLEKRVSTYQDSVYVGENGEFGVSFVTGEAEKLIVIDGEVGECARFATLTVTPLSSELYNNTYSYILKGEAGEKTGELVKDVVGAAFSAEVPAAEEIGKVLSVTVKADGILESEVELMSKLEGAMTWREALAVAEKAFAEEITAESDTGELSREIYVKLVNALSDADAPYYYYVSFIKSSSDYWAILLDPVTGEIISKKV